MDSDPRKTPPLGKLAIFKGPAKENKFPSSGWIEAEEGQLWFVRFKGYQWPLRQCLIDEILEHCVRLISVDVGMLGIDGHYEIEKDVDLVQRLKEPV